MLSLVAPFVATITIIAVGVTTGPLFRSWLGPDYHRSFVYNFFVYVIAFGAAVFTRSLLPLEGNAIPLGIGLALGMGTWYVMTNKLR